MTRAGAPLGALLRHFSIPGHAFGDACASRSSASSWREIRSDLQVEPRVARDRHACRAREPRNTGTAFATPVPRKYQRRISAAFLRPAPPPRRLM